MKRPYYETADTDHDGVADSCVIHFDAENSVTVYNVTKLTGADFDILA